MTPIATIGAIFALGFHSYMVWWTFDTITVARRPRGQESVRYPVTWHDYVAAFFWPLTFAALLFMAATGKRGV